MLQAWAFILLCTIISPMLMATELHLPTTRRGQYDGKMSQYLIDLHDSHAVFDFCGGMMFQLVLTDKLRTQLASIEQDELVVQDAATDKMQKMENYTESAEVDNIRLFHGREVRKVPNAAGGMHFVLQLCSSLEDPEGWTSQERDGYDGWGHDASRTWRDGKRLEGEGIEGFRDKFGPEAFTLNHRFYWHLDRTDQLWLAAEDGCEGRLFSTSRSRDEL